MIDVLGVLAAAPAHKPLPGVFHKFEPLLHHWGYLAVGVSLFVENMGIPLPGQLVLIAAALYAGTGNLNIYVVAVVGLLACCTGSAVGYLVGEYGGRPVLERYGKYILITGERLEKAEHFFAERGALVLLLGRFVEGVRQAAAILAGISEMSFARFILFYSAGAVIWVGFWTTISDIAGDHITTIYQYAAYAAAGIGVIIVLLLVRMAVRARRRSRSLPQSLPEPQG